MWGILTEDILGFVNWIEFSDLQTISLTVLYICKLRHDLHSTMELWMLCQNSNLVPKGCSPVHSGQCTVCTALHCTAPLQVSTGQSVISRLEPFYYGFCQYWMNVGSPNQTGKKWRFALKVCLHSFLGSQKVISTHYWLIRNKIGRLIDWQQFWHVNI
jgi:hypothetical protein